MKVIALTRTPEMQLTNPPSLEVIVDSATVQSVRPLFLPDFPGEWCALIYPAFKICRLGKDISENFAPRYYDSFTLALRLFPLGMDKVLTEGDMDKGVLGIFDYCLAFGEWHPWDDSAIAIDMEISDSRFTVTREMLAVNRVVESVSHYTTLKTGDVILPCRLPVQLPVKAGNDISVKTAGSGDFNFKIR